MYLLIRRLRAKKLTKQADHQISQTRSLLDERGTEMDSDDRDTIRDRLVYAGDLRAGLDVQRWGQLKQAKAFHEWAEETLRIIKEEMLPPPDPQIATRRLRRRINS